MVGASWISRQERSLSQSCSKSEETFPLKSKDHREAVGLVRVAAAKVQALQPRDDP